jgi:hypothetical protein
MFSFIPEFKKMIKGEGYMPEQISNVDEAIDEYNILY